MRVQGKVKVRSKQRKHNLNSNNNLMGFDTIEINLVVRCEVYAHVIVIFVCSDSSLLSMFKIATEAVQVGFRVLPLVVKNK